MNSTSKIIILNSVDHKMMTSLEDFLDSVMTLDSQISTNLDNLHSIIIRTNRLDFSLQIKALQTSIGRIKALITSIFLSRKNHVQW
mmetsp:Transcript_32378/g.36912  ORF Transcript_32378/g.36912 Transcript_32378/m.36912 type:complete len:86 (-) Transcript_32378:176-433(-)